MDLDHTTVISLKSINPYPANVENKVSW